MRLRGGAYRVGAVVQATPHGAAAFSVPFQPAVWVKLVPSQNFRHGLEDLDLWISRAKTTFRHAVYNWYRGKILLRFPQVVHGFTWNVV